MWNATTGGQMNRDPNGITVSSNLKQTTDNGHHNSGLAMIQTMRFQKAMENNGPVQCLEIVTTTSRDCKNSQEPIFKTR